MPTAIELARDAVVAERRASGRSAVLERYSMLAAEADSPFDRTMALAADLLATPIAFVSLVNGGEHWLDDQANHRDARTSRDGAVFAAAVLREGALVVADAQRDERFGGNRVANGSRPLRFFAGARLETADGLAFGALCVAATEQRPSGTTARQERALALLAEQAMAQIELRDVANQSLWRAGEQIRLSLHESEEHYRHTVEHLPQATWTADAEGNLLTISPRWFEWTGLATEAALRQGYLSVVHPDDLSIANEHLTHSIQTGATLDMRVRVRNADGTYRWTRAHGVPRRGPDGAILRWYGSTEDIDEQVLADQTLRQLQKQLIHVSRVSAMGTMASALAHELNQPLTAAANLLNASQQLLSRRAESDPIVVELMGKAAEQTLRIGDIIRRLRKLVANGRASIEAIALRPVVEEAIFLARTSDFSGAAYVVAIPDVVPPVLADAVQVQQVLINLIRNATEAMATSAVQRITIAASSCPDGVEVSVTDTGPGVPPERRDRLFMAFDSGKADGLGVGLSISRTIVEAHGGRIWLADAPGGGARFCFTVPAADDR